MRDAHMMGILPIESVRLILASAKLREQQIYFEDVRMASQFCLTSLMVCQLGFVSATSQGSWFLLAKALKIALKENVIAETDLFMTDEDVWRKLNDAHNAEIDAYLARLMPGREFVYASKDDAEFSGPNKARYVDPLVLQKDGSLRRTSELVVGLSAYINDFKQRCQHISVRQK